MPNDAESNESTFADKLDHLFRTITGPDGKAYTHKDVEEGTDGAVTAAYVWKLRTGKKMNPGYKVIAALCQFFKVNPNYFFEPIDKAELRTLLPSNSSKHLLNEDATEIALRASELDNEGQRTVSEMINYIRKLKQEKGDAPVGSTPDELEEDSQT